MALTQISTQGIKDGTITGSDLATNVDLVDNQKLRLGNSQDLQIFHNGTDSRIVNTTGDLSVRGGVIKLASTTGEEYIRCTANSSVDLFHDNVVKLTTNSDGYRSNDNVKAQFGDGNDLQIYHDGSHSRIDEVGTGNLMIQSNNAVFIKKGTSEEIAKFNVDGAVELYHNNIKTFETTGEGVTFDTGSSSCVVRLTSNTDAITVLQGFNSDFLLKAPSGGSVSILTNANESSINCITNGAVELYHDNVLKLTTLSAGVQMANGSGNNTFSIFDSDKLSFGNNGDLKIFHDGGDNHIDSVSNAHKLKIQAEANIELRRAGANEVMAIFSPNAGVELYFNNSLRLSTTANGVTLGHNLFLDNATNAGRDVTWDPSNDQLQWKDNTKASFGSGSDLQIYHDGSNSYIDETKNANNLFIRGQANIIIGFDSEKMAVFSPNGPVELYHDNSKKCETRSDGLGVEGDLTLQGGSRDKFIGGNANNLELGTYSSSNTSRDVHLSINSAGNVFIGTTTENPGFGNNSDPGNFFAHSGYAMHSRNSGTALFIARNDSTGSLVSFNYNGGGQIADITTNGSSVSYGTGSDYRLKENITTLTNAITRLKNLKPSRFNFLKTPSITQDGFIAHEVQEVVPEAVTGVKDEVRTEDGDMGEKTGDPVMQSLDVAKLVPLLTAGLQEAISKIELLETEVAALKAG